VSSPAVKVCGVCAPADAALAAAAGAAYVGVILAPGRRRTRTLSQAADIFRASSVRRVGVFVDADPVEVLRAVERLRLDVVQLHGDEPVAAALWLAERMPAQVWKAVRVRAPEDVAAAAQAYAGVAHGLLLDGWSRAGHGGTGTAFDWAAVAAARPALPADTTLIVAGGLHADNVAAAVALLAPQVVDVSSGVEAAPGRKSPERLHAFIAAARAGQGGSS
jgi:phosphoribosylanthranilate isomerase